MINYIQPSRLVVIRWRDTSISPKNTISRYFYLISYWFFFQTLKTFCLSLIRLEKCSNLTEQYRTKQQNNKPNKKTTRETLPASRRNLSRGEIRGEYGIEFILPRCGNDLINRKEAASQGSPQGRNSSAMCREINRADNTPLPIELR